MAKNTIVKKIIWKLKSIRNWFSIKYHRWFKKEVPTVFHIYDNDYEFERKESIDKLEHKETQNDILETYAYEIRPDEDRNYTRMQAAKALTRGKPEPGRDMPRLIRERRV